MLAVGVAGVLLVGLRWVQQQEPDALLSQRMEAKAIRAARGLDDYFKGLDRSADKTADKVRELQRMRFDAGVGTHFASTLAERDLQTTDDWGRDGADPWAAVSVDSRQSTPAHGSHKARIEQLAEPFLYQPSHKVVGKDIVRQADQGLFGSSLTGLVKNVFGGPKSSISKYAETHQAKSGSYHWSALGEAHWDANGDPILPTAVKNDRGLAGAGVKMSNSLKELYKDTDRVPVTKRVAGKGTLHLVRLMDNLLYGKSIKSRRNAREEKEEKAADFTRELEEHKFDDKKLVGKSSSFFHDDESVPAEQPNQGLLTKMLFPQPKSAVADASYVARHLKDNEMLISGSNGFFKDTNDENPMDKVLAMPAASLHESRRRQMRQLEKQRAHQKETSGVEAVNDVQVANTQGAASRQEHSAVTSTRRKSPDLLETAERAVLRAEKREHHVEGKVRHDERRQESERNQVRRMERSEQRKGQARAAKEELKGEATTMAVQEARVKKAREEGKAEALGILKEQRKEALRAQSAKALSGQEMEAREVPSGKETEGHVSGQQERQAVSNYFKKLAKEDKYKHILGMSVIHKEEVARPGEKAWADGTDRRDMMRDNKFFDKVAEHDKKKAERWRVKRIQDRKDLHSLHFLEAADRSVEKATVQKDKMANSEVPRAFKEWEHAEATIGINEDAKRMHLSPRHTATLQQPSGQHAAGDKNAMQEDKNAMQEGLMQTHIKAAISRALGKDVTPESDQAVASGIQKPLHQRAARRSKIQRTDAISPVEAAPKSHAKTAAATTPQVHATLDSNHTEYQYQKQHLAQTLDTPEPSAKRQLDQFLHHPISTVESLF